jgi:environmental stress-induced protein Ves
VRGGVVRRAWQGAPVQATVQPDGSFSGTGGIARMTGQITGNHMVLDILGQTCGYHYDLTRG